MLLRFIFRIVIFSVSIYVFVNFLVNGDKGIKSHLEVKRDVVVQRLEINKLKDKVEKLTSELEDWKKDKFLVEKTAREDLLLGMPGEKVYIIK